MILFALEFCNVRDFWLVKGGAEFSPYQNRNGRICVTGNITVKGLETGKDTPDFDFDDMPESSETAKSDSKISYLYHQAMILGYALGLDKGGFRLPKDRSVDDLCHYRNILIIHLVKKHPDIFMVNKYLELVLLDKSKISKTPLMERRPRNTLFSATGVRQNNEDDTKSVLTSLIRKKPKK
ncbi:hypothetical protein CLU79DRAFT_849624 [Phycomyces nitens]|nr:hypothetical protein CLU79DRAFT_849624 [Phycomyces nitens]